MLLSFHTLSTGLYPLSLSGAHFSQQLFKVDPSDGSLARDYYRAFYADSFEDGQVHTWLYLSFFCRPRMERVRNNRTTESVFLCALCFMSILIQTIVTRVCVEGVAAVERTFLFCFVCSSSTSSVPCRTACGIAFASVHAGVEST